jgi:hypothetical protein
VNLFLWRMAASLAGLWISLAIVFYCLERLGLIRMAEMAGQGDGSRPPSLVAWLFIGFLLLNATLFYALTRWARFIRSNPATPQAPVSVLIALVAVCGAALIAAMAIHSTYLWSLEVVPMEVSWGYIAFQIIAGSVALIALVLIAVRWSPGYRREFVKES